MKNKNDYDLIVECHSNSMANGLKKSINVGDWVYSKSVPKEYLKNTFEKSKKTIYVIDHIKLGILIKSIESLNTTKQTIKVNSLNPDKTKYPNFEIKINDCNAIYQVKQVHTHLN